MILRWYLKDRVQAILYLRFLTTKYTKRHEIFYRVVALTNELASGGRFGWFSLSRRSGWFLVGRVGQVVYV